MVGILEAECSRMADLLREVHAVIQSIEGEDEDERGRLFDLIIQIETAIESHDERRISETTGSNDRCCGRCLANRLEIATQPR